MSLVCFDVLVCWLDPVGSLVVLYPLSLSRRTRRNDTRVHLLPCALLCVACVIAACYYVFTRRRHAGVVDAPTPFYFYLFLLPGSFRYEQQNLFTLMELGDKRGNDKNNEGAASDMLMDLNASDEELYAANQGHGVPGFRRISAFVGNHMPGGHMPHMPHMPHVLSHVSKTSKSGQHTLPTLQHVGPAPRTSIITSLLQRKRGSAVATSVKIHMEKEEEGPSESKGGAVMISQPARQNRRRSSTVGHGSEVGSVAPKHHHLTSDKFAHATQKAIPRQKRDPALQRMSKLLRRPETR